MPRQGVRLPVNRCGNLMGRMTASLSDSLAISSPATSSQRTLGLSTMMALARPDLSFLTSGSCSSPSSSFLCGQQSSDGDEGQWQTQRALIPSSSRTTICHPIRANRTASAFLSSVGEVFLEHLCTADVLDDFGLDELFRLVVLLVYKACQTKNKEIMG